MLLPVIFYYRRLNCYSFNALAGAIDASPELSGLKIDIALNAARLRACASERVRRHGRAVVAFSVLTCQLKRTGSIIQELRSDLGSNVVIIAGGAHATACPEDLLEMGADCVIRGEAELAFPKLLGSIMQGDWIRGSITGEPVDIEAFASFSPGRGMFGPIEITRGCAFACSYCQTSHIFGTRLRHRSVDTIVRQAETLRSINRKVVRLLSPNAFSYGSSDGRVLNLDAVRELLHGLRTRLGPSARIIFAHFPSEVRPEHVTPDTLDLLKEFADNDEIVIGAQSGSRRMLDACRRSHDVKSVLNAVVTARRYGYKIIVDFIFGLPDETEADLKETFSLMDEVVGRGARIHPHIFAPLPQTAFADREPGRLSPEVNSALNRIRSRGGLYENKSRTGDQM